MIHLEHIGIAVQDAPAVQALMQTLFNVLSYKSETVTSESVETIFLALENVKLELLKATADTSAVAKFLEKKGEGLHHLAFEVQDIDATFERLKAAGFTPLNPEPKHGADGKRIFFLHPKQTHGILIEFCQSRDFGFVDAPSVSEEIACFPMGNPQNPAMFAFQNEQDLYPLYYEAQRDFYILDMPIHSDEDWAQNASKILEQEDIKEAVLVAQGETCTAALSVAVAQAERIKGVVLLNFCFEKESTKYLAALQQPLLLIGHENQLEAPHYFALKSFVNQVHIAILPDDWQQCTPLAMSLIKRRFLHK